MNEAFREAAKGAQAGILAVVDEPLVSVDFRCTDVSTSIDSSLTMVMGARGSVLILTRHPRLANCNELSVQSLTTTQQILAKTSTSRPWPSCLVHVEVACTPPQHLYAARRISQWCRVLIRRRRHGQGCGVV